MRNIVLAVLFLISAPGFSDMHMPYCAKSTISIPLDEAAFDIGFSARDLLNLAVGQHHLNWTWDYKAGTTNFTLRVRSVAREARYIDSVAIYPPGSPKIHIVCPDRVEVDAWVDFFTSDGDFAERWSTTIYDTDGTDCFPPAGEVCSAPGTEAKFSHKFNRENLNGTFYSDVPVAEDLTLDFFAEGRFSREKVSAIVSGQAYSCSADACNSYVIYGGHTL